MKKVEKLFQLILINTVPADSVEMRHIILDLARTALLGRLHDAVDTRHIQVHNPMAFGTDKMMMPGGVAVETVSSSVSGDFHDLAQIGEKSQVPVNGSQADVRKFLPDIHIDGIGGGMVRPGGEESLDTFSLFASFQICHIFFLLPQMHLPNAEASIYYRRKFLRSGGRLYLIMITITDTNKILQIPAFVNAFLFAVERKMCPFGKNFFLYIFQQAHVLFSENLLY